MGMKPWIGKQNCSVKKDLQHLKGRAEDSLPIPA